MAEEAAMALAMVVAEAAVDEVVVVLAVAKAAAPCGT